MHPTSSRPVQLPDPPNETCVFIEAGESQVYKSILSFPNGSASGLDVLSPQHLQDLVSRSANEKERQLLENLTKLVNFMFRGKVSEELLKFLYGANLCALTKKDDGSVD